jgi:hypothetical protein
VTGTGVIFIALLIHNKQALFKSYERTYVFIMNQQSESYRQNMYVSVGVMKDYKLKLRNLLVSHTLSWSWNWNT